MFESTSTHPRLHSFGGAARFPTIAGPVVIAGRIGTFAVAIALAACATAPSTPEPPSIPQSAPPVPRHAEPPPPKINLSGFPLAYRQGYADGCASATGPQRRDGERFGKDTDYSMGWQDGVSLCKKR